MNSGNFWCYCNPRQEAVFTYIVSSPRALSTSQENKYQVPGINNKKSSISSLCGILNVKDHKGKLFYTFHVMSEIKIVLYGLPLRPTNSAIPPGNFEVLSRESISKLPGGMALLVKGVHRGKI